MPNYRNNTTPYCNCRQNMTVSAEKMHHNTWDDMPLAMAYVPWQTWCDIYDAEKGFCKGTIFQELNLPFRGVGGCQK